MEFAFDEDLASKVTAIISLLTFDDGRALNRKLTSARGWLSKCVAARDEVALLMKWDDLSPLYNVLGAGEDIPDAQLSESRAPTAKEGNDISKAMGKLMKQYCTYLRSLDELEQDLKAALTSSTPRRRRRRKGASTPSSGGSSTPRSGAGTPDRGQVRPVRPAIIEPNASRMPPNAGAGMATTTKRKKPPSVTPSDIASVALIPSEWTTFDPVESSKEETASVMDIHAEIDAAAKARGFAGSVAPSSITFSGANNMKYTPEQRRLFAQAKKAYKESKTVLQQHLQSAEACTTLIAQTDKLQNELDRLKEFLNKLPSDDPRRRRFDRAIKDKEYEISEADERHELLVRTSNAALGRTTSLRKRAVELKTEALSLTPSLDPLDEANLEKAKTHAMNWAE